MLQCPGKPERKDTFGILHPAPFFSGRALTGEAHLCRIVIHAQINEVTSARNWALFYASGRGCKTCRPIANQQTGNGGGRQIVVVVIHWIEKQLRVKMTENLNMKGLQGTDFTESTFLPRMLPLCLLYSFLSCTAKS